MIAGTAQPAEFTRGISSLSAECDASVSAAPAFFQAPARVWGTM